MNIQPFPIILATGQPVFFEGLKSILASEENLECRGAARNIAELENLLASNSGVLVLEGNPDFFNVNEVRISLARYPDCKIMILSEEKEQGFIELVQELNVYAYLSKNCSVEELKKAIYATCRGQKYFCSSVIDFLLDRKNMSDQHTRGISVLSAREKEITRLIAEGKMNKEIAAQLCLSPHTVHSHRKNIMKKLGVHSAVELINFATDAGLLR